MADVILCNMTFDTPGCKNLEPGMKTWEPCNSEFLLFKHNLFTMVTICIRARVTKLFWFWSHGCVNDFLNNIISIFNTSMLLSTGPFQFSFICMFMAIIVIQLYQ